MCGTKNFSSVRLYSAPQLLHRTIVSIPGICAFGEQDQAGSFVAIKSDPLSGLGLNIARSASCWLHVGCILLDHARKIRDRPFVDGRRLRLSRLPLQCTARSGRQIVIRVGLGTHDCPLRVGMLMSLSNAQVKITPYKWVHPEEER